MAWVLGCLVLVLLLGREHYPALPQIIQRAWWWLLCVVAAVMLVDTVELALSRLSEAREWDFLTYWLDGRVAVQGLNFYDPASFAQQPLPLKPSPDFVAEILQVGMYHPPPTILLFAPFGLLDYFSAYELWSALNGLVLLACVYLLYRLYWKGERISGLLLTLALVLMFYATNRTVHYGQSNFILLMLLILASRDRERPLAGVWIALGICVKPLFVVLLGWLVLRGKVLAVATATAVVSVLLGVVVILFGHEVVLAYFTDPPTGRIPDYLYYQKVNRSALANMLRYFDVRTWQTSPVFYPPFVAFALIVGSVTLWAVLKSQRTQWTLCATLIAGLLVYPHSLAHYSVLLLVPVSLIWARRADACSVAMVVALVFVMNALSDYEGVFPSYLMLWGMTIYRCGVFGSLPKIRDPQIRPDG